MTVVLKKRRNQSSPLSVADVDSNWDVVEAALNESGTGDGTVTSVSIGNLTPVFTAAVANGTTTPAITFTQVSQNQNLVFAAPNGSSGVPTFRALVANDLPVTPVAKGGTNSNTALTNNKVVVSSGGAIVESSTVDTTELEYLNGINGLTNGVLKKGTGVLSTGAVDLTSSEVTGILPIARGGIGISSTPSNGRILIGNGSGYTLASITAGSGIAVTNGAGSISIASSIPTINSLTGALTIAAGTSGSDVSVNSSSTTITINVPTASSSARGALSSADWSLFNNKVGRTFNTGNTISFGYDVWYITGNATLPNITTNDIGKVLFVKNTATSNSSLTADGTDTIDKAGVSSISLSHNSGGSGLQGGVIIQAMSETMWQVIASFGTINYE